ncbi:energy transducer TonB [Anabaena sp. UHCC 0399]|uniref:energy transducer TonB n=1 Tax=Anabaena sp. UHCC 0399 TaxID=3110238 RepID=UPI002B2083A8|nr:energy transducer TonB [Anabaena sp. UHCC 0399]MEA5567272.1 energy transducer TonB [Anabaena sp. UHCC 0399]
MTFSGIAVEQRSKETEALRSFLVYSLIGSVALHIGILAIGIGNLLQRTPDLENEPLEVTIVDPPTVETEPTPLEIKPEPKPEPETRPQPQKIAPVAIAPVKLNPEPVQKVSNNLKTPQVQQPPEKISTPTQKLQSTTQPQPVLTSEPTNTQQTAIQAVEQSSNKLRGLLNGIRDTRANSDAVGESNNSTTTGSNVPVQSSNNRRSRGIETQATAPSPTKIETPPSSNNTNNSSRSGNGRAACRDCGIKYPEAARRRGVEGKVEVAVDTDEKGNVTNVRIVNSSGNRDLDQETLRQARNWKLKPSASGRSGVSIATEYAITGSRRYRELQERKRQAQARQQAAAANRNTTEAESSSRQTSRASSNTETSTRSNTETRVRRRRLSPTSQPSTASSTNNTRTSENQRSIRNSFIRAQRERTDTPSSSRSQPTATRRRRRIPTQEASSSSASKLRNALRRSRQPSQSSSPEASTSSGE